MAAGSFFFSFSVDGVGLLQPGLIHTIGRCGQFLQTTAVAYVLLGRDSLFQSFKLAAVEALVVGNIYVSSAAVSEP